MGAPPAPHEEATQEQLSAVRALLKDDLAPYVDMCPLGVMLRLLPFERGVPLRRRRPLSLIRCGGG
eukprot:865488-Amphidinium_carterae.1